VIFKQIPEILSGAKWQTRRVVKPGEGMYEASLALTAAGNVKWAVGKTYAVQPGRGKPGIERWRETEDGIEWQPIRIRILAIRQERLQDITEDDAKAEGVADVAAYCELWESINGKTPGARWDANPMVWVLTFEVVNGEQS